MARDDYFVIVCRILSYLYICLKCGEPVDMDEISFEKFGIREEYWNYIMIHMKEAGYVEGVTVLPVLGRSDKRAKLTEQFAITPAGIEYIEDNSKMNKVKGFLKTLKEIIPGI